MMRAACIQMTSGDDKQANLRRAGALLAQAADAGAELALLPENFAFMGADDEAKRAASESEDDSSILSFLAEQATKFSMSIIAGSVLLQDENSARLRNTCVVFSSSGKRLASYDKIHLFDAQAGGESYRESDIIRPGNRPVIAHVRDWDIGLSVCYDLRFPELYRHYSASGCAILSIPSAFTVSTGKAHWQTLLRARAIENQCYVLAAGQCGVHPGGRQTWGHSMMLNPWGDVIAELPDGEGIIVADISRHQLAAIRNQLPVLKHRLPIEDDS